MSKSVKELLVELQTDIKYIKEYIGEKCKVYDKHIDESPEFKEKMGERMLKLEQNEVSCKFNLSKDIKAVGDRVTGIEQCGKEQAKNIWKIALVASVIGAILVLSGKEGLAWAFKEIMGAIR